MWWFRLAHELKMSVQETQAKTTSTEFNDWQWYFNEYHLQRREKVEWYLAELLAEVRRSWVKHPNRIQMKPLEFEIATRTQGRNEMSPEEMQAVIRGWLGVTKKDEQ